MQTTMILLAGLAFAASDVPSSQEISVERAARQFRIHLYDTYRTDRVTYDHFREVGDELLANWQAAGQPSEHRHEVLAWYQDAAPTDLAVSLPPLPDLPIRLPPQPEATVNADPFLPFEANPHEDAQPVTPLPFESGEVLFESPDQTDQTDQTDHDDEADEVLPISTSAAPIEDHSRTLAEKWSNSPKSIMTLGRFAIGVAGF